MTGEAAMEYGILDQVLYPAEKAVKAKEAKPEGKGSD
jgi:hypothetical protein